MGRERLKLRAFAGRLARLYTGCGLLLLNTVVLLVALDGAAALILAVRPPQSGIAETVEQFEARMLGMSYYASQDWARSYWKEHTEVVDHWAYHPYTIWRSLPYSGQNINVDERGVRVTPNTHCDRTDAYKIYVFGGSTVWGYGVPDWATIPAYIQEQLRDLGERICVVNYGELAFNSTQEVIQLMGLLQRGDAPDMAIFYDGNNDVWIAGRTSAPGTHFYVEDISPVVQGGLVNNPGESAGGLLVKLAAQTALYRLLVGEPETPQPNWASPPFAPEFVDGIVNTYMANMRAVQALSKEYGFAYFGFVQPVLPLTKRPLNDEEQAIMWNTPASVADLFRTVYPRLEEAIAPYPNLRYFGSILDEQPYPIWIDFHHLTPWGNLAIAHEIAQVVRPTVEAALAKE